VWEARYSKVIPEAEVISVNLGVAGEENSD
jgi:hypothetical protein